MLLAVSASDIENMVKVIVNIIGGAVLLIGAIDALSGYSNQSSGKLSEGIIKAIGGAGIMIIGSTLVSKIFEGITF